MNDNFQNTKNAIVTYFKGVKMEWGKITWPEKQQVVVETFFVVAIVFIFTLFIFLVDKGFETFFNLLFK
jgi:preprotein translocase subunit SecE